MTANLRRCLIGHFEKVDPYNAAGICAVLKMMG